MKRTKENSDLYKKYRLRAIRLILVRLFLQDLYSDLGFITMLLLIIKSSVPSFMHDMKDFEDFRNWFLGLFVTIMIIRLLVSTKHYFTKALKESILHRKLYKKIYKFAIRDIKKTKKAISRKDLIEKLICNN